MVERTSAKLAKIRRVHGGSWRITFIVEGFDQEFTRYCGIKFREHMAEAMCRSVLARELDVRTLYIHTKSIIREG